MPRRSCRLSKAGAIATLNIRCTDTSIHKAEPWLDRKKPCLKALVDRDMSDGAAPCSTFGCGIRPRCEIYALDRRRLAEMAGMGCVCSRIGEHGFDRRRDGLGVNQTGKHCLVANHIGEHKSRSLRDLMGVKLCR